MPYSQYVAGREPPSLADRILAHSQTIPLSLLSFIFGLLIVVSITTDIEISRSLAESEPFVMAAVAAPLVAGPPAIIHGALNPGLRMRPLTAMALERAGSIATGAGAAAFALGILLSGNTLAIGTALVTTAVSLAFLLQALALKLTEVRVKARRDAEITGG